MMLTLAQGNNLQEAAQGILKQYNLQAVESQHVNVNGSNAIAMVADQKQEQGTLRTLSYVIQYDNHLYHLIGVTTLADFNSYANSFSQTMQNFNRLTDPSKLNKKPERIRLKTISQASSLEQALKRLGVPEKRHNEIAVLNAMKLKDKLEPGTLIKIIGN